MLRLSGLYDGPLLDSKGVEICRAFDDKHRKLLHPDSKLDRFVALLVMQQRDDVNEKQLRKLKEPELKRRVLQTALCSHSGSSPAHAELQQKLAALGQSGLQEAQMKHRMEDFERDAAALGIYLHQDLEDIDLDHQTAKGQGDVVIDWPEFLVIVARLRTMGLLVKKV